MVEQKQSRTHCISGACLGGMMCMIIIVELIIYGSYYVRTTVQGQVHKIDSVEINKVPIQIVSIHSLRGECNAVMHTSIRKFELNDYAIITIPEKNGECHFVYGWIHTVLFATLAGNMLLMWVLCLVIEEEPQPVPAKKAD